MHDHTMLEAMDDLGADIRRLNQHHRIEGWTVTLQDGTLQLLCSCDRRLHPATPGDNHYVDVIRALRGPMRKAR